MSFAIMRRLLIKNDAFIILYKKTYERYNYIPTEKFAFFQNITISLF